MYNIPVVVSEYEKAVGNISDINEHVPTLSKYGEECEHIVEFGVRSGVSSWGFINGLLKNIRDGRSVRIEGVDLSPSPTPYEFLKTAGILNLTSSFTQGNVLHVPAVECDLLFIDTFHVYGQLKRELNRHAAGVRKYIIMHDTTVDEFEGELRRCGWNAEAMSAQTGIPAEELVVGLWPAIVEFLAEHPEWYMKEKFTNNNGLTILERRTDTISLVPTTYCTKPISFSIPACKLVTEVPTKDKLFGHVVPGDLSTYIFADEVNYYADYRRSVFGRTCKKAGWDCLRHYEILANGCIPWFTDLDKCPEMTLTHFPKTLVLKAMKELERVDPGDPAVLTCINELLKYTRTRLTTKAMASWVLETSGFSDAKSILYLSSDPAPDYLRCTLLHGFKELLQSQCHDYSEVPHLYTDCVTSTDQLYGKGFSYTRLLSKVDSRDPERDLTLTRDIQSRRYDVIVYGSVHRGMPFWELVNKHYEKHEILLFCGEDIETPCCSLQNTFSNYRFSVAK